MKWTNCQQEAITFRDKNMLVAAAAGSGKTAVLVERIKQLVICDKVSINEMLVVTFTNAAASEMKEKIVAALTKEIENNPDESAFLRKQLNGIYKANISTFHSFALEIIRRYFYIINIEPNFKICDEAENVILKTESMEELFDNLFQSGDQGFINFLNKYAASKNENNVKVLINSLYTMIKSIPDSFGWLEDNMASLSMSKEEFLKGKVAGEIEKTIRKNIEFSIKSFKRAEGLLLEEGLTSLAVKADMDITQLEEVLEGFETKGLEQILYQVSSLQFQRFTVTKEEKEGYETIKERVEQVRDKGKGFIKKIKETYTVRGLDDYIGDLQATWEDTKYLAFLTGEFHLIFKGKKQEKNLVDFNDIEHFALEILKSDPVAEEYRSKFKHIFVDEYQDSNLLQDYLISKIKRDNNLFMVGDVKQSIYKFRLAEPEIFMEKYEKYRKIGDGKDMKIDLNQNFRSKSSIINGVNDVFSRIMNQYDKEAALYKGVEYAGDLDYPVEIHIIDQQAGEQTEIDEEILALKMAELEAHHVVRLIKKEIGREIFDVKQNLVRKITNRDVVVLLRATKNYADKFYRIFTEEDIPAHVDDSEGYFDTIEIEVVLNLLRVIDNKRQDIPLISLLHSIMLGFSIEELAKIRGENKRGSFYEAFSGYGKTGEDRQLAEKTENARCKIEEWQEMSKFMPLEDLIWKLLRDTGYYNYAAALPAGVQRQANLRLLIDKAIKFQSGSLKGLYGFISYIDAIKARSVRTGQVSLVGENDDVVRIMTIHKSKGLEFPVVIVAGLGKQFNQSKDTSILDMHKDMGLSLSYLDNARKYYRKTILQNAIKEKNKALDLEEEIRILYVAFTRAMDKLILIGTIKDLGAAKEKYDLTEMGDTSTARCFLDMIMPAIKESEMEIIYHTRDEIMPINNERNSNRRVMMALLQGESTLEIDEMLSNEIDKRLAFTYGFMNGVNQKSKLSVTEINKGTKDAAKYRERLRAPVFETGKREFSGSEKGTIIHDFMMQLDFKKAYGALQNSKESFVGFFDKTIKELVEAKFFTEDETKVINPERIIRFFQSGIGIRAAKAEELHKEAAFSMIMEIGGEDVIVQGIIDCYFKENGEYVLIDYKTNTISDAGDPELLAELKEMYQEQIRLYEKAINVSRGIRVKESYLYLFGADIEMSVS